MIELTSEQARAVEDLESTPLHVVNPGTGEIFVLLRLEQYHCLDPVEYDDSPWTKQELQTLAWEAGRSAGWEELDEYDNDQPIAR